MVLLVNSWQIVEKYWGRKSCSCWPDVGKGTPAMLRQLSESHLIPETSLSTLCCHRRTWQLSTIRTVLGGREKWHFSRDHMCCTCGSSLWALSYRAHKGPLRRPARRHPPFLNIQSQSFLENLKIFHTWQTSKGAVDMVFRIQLQLERSVFERWLWWPEKLNNPQSKAPPIWEFALA